MPEHKHRYRVDATGWGPRICFLCACGEFVLVLRKTFWRV